MSRNVPVSSKKGTAPFDRDGLRYVNLDVTDVMAVPDRLIEPIGESQSENVSIDSLPREMSMRKTCGLVETLGDGGVEAARRGEVGSKGFSQMIFVFSLRPVFPASQ